MSCYALSRAVTPTRSITNGTPATSAGRSSTTSRVCFSSTRPRRPPVMFPDQDPRDPLHPLRPSQPAYPLPHPQNAAVPTAGPAANSPFEATPLSPGGMPHLMEFLLAEYRNYLQSEIQRRRVRGQATVSLDEALSVAPLRSFYDFCVRYLAVNRPVENFFVDLNHG